MTVLGTSQWNGGREVQVRSKPTLSTGSVDPMPSTLKIRTDARLLRHDQTHIQPGGRSAVDDGRHSIRTFRSNSPSNGSTASAEPDVTRAASRQWPCRDVVYPGHRTHHSLLDRRMHEVVCIGGRFCTHSNSARVQPMLCGMKSSCAG